MKRVIDDKPKALDEYTETYARRIMANIAASGAQTHPTDPRQAMMLEHFNQHPSRAATFSHYSLGTKLRRYGR